MFNILTFDSVFCSLTSPEICIELYCQCKHVYKTGYKKYCSTVHDEECRISYSTSFKTVYDKKCSTHYVKSCHDVGYGYHKGACIFSPTDKFMFIIGEEMQFSS